MVPRSTFSTLSAVQVAVLSALLINGAIVNNAISRQFGGRSTPLNPIGSDLAAASFFYNNELGPDVSKGLAQAALATFPKDSHSAAFYMANLEIALANISKNPQDYSAVMPYATKAMDGYYNLAKKHHRHRHIGHPLAAVAWTFYNYDQPELALRAVRDELARLEDQKHELQCRDEPCDYMRLAEIYEVGRHINHDLGYYATAEDYAKKSLVYSRMADDAASNHMRHFRPEQVIAIALIKQEKFEEALAYAQAYQRHAGRYSPDDEVWSNVLVALIQAKMGFAEQSLKTFSDAEGLKLEQNLDQISDSQYGGVLSFYADLLDARGESQRAADQILRVCKTHGFASEGLADKLKTNNRRAEFLTNAGNPDQAIKLLNKTIKIRESKIGVSSLDTAKSYALLAEAQFQKGQIDAALKNYAQALKIERKVSDPAGPLVARHQDESDYARDMCRAPVLTGYTDGVIYPHTVTTAPKPAGF